VLSLPVKGAICTDITVSPNPANGIIKMESGQIYFQMPQSSSEHSINSLNYNTSSAYQDVGNNMSHFDDFNKAKSHTELPYWLIWGGENENVTENSQEGKKIRSAIQAFMEISMKWENNDNNQAMKQQIKKLSNIIQLNRNKDEPAFDNRYSINSQINTTSLPIKASVNVKVDLNLPLSGVNSGIFNFGPLNFVLSQAGSLATLSIMKILSPVLSEALVKDYLLRKEAENDFIDLNQF
jgi:hypothetical protein